MLNGVEYKDDACIESAAQAILSRFGVERAPVDPIDIATKMGIDVFDAEFEDDSISGMLRQEGNGYTIFVNEKHPKSRRRFTVAHELGHFELHKEYGEFVDSEINMFRTGDSSTGANRLEIQANRFAAALLMPEHLLTNARQVTEDIDSLARLFGVSRRDGIPNRQYADRDKLRTAMSKATPVIKRKRRRTSINEIADRHSKDRSYAARKAIKVWETQAREERSMRKEYAWWLVLVLCAQIALINLSFFMIGFGWLDVEPWTGRIFIVATFGELAAMVFFIVRYLFSRDDRSLLYIAEILRLDARSDSSRN